MLEMRCLTKFASCHNDQFMLAELGEQGTPCDKTKMTWFKVESSSLSRSRYDVDWWKW